MKYSIAFFGEANFPKAHRIPRDYENMRTDLAWPCALEADCYAINEENIIFSKEKYDIALIIIPKYNKAMQLLLFEYFGNLRKRFKKIICIQEGPKDLIHDFSIKDQFTYLNLLRKFDAILCHQGAKQYFHFLTELPCYHIPTLMITDLIEDMHKEKELNENKKINVIISGNIGNWYHGLDAYVMIEKLKKHFNIQPYCVSMRKKDPSEQFYTKYRYLPYVDWYNWMKLLNTMDIGINITRRTGAETFNLNCDYLGIPVIKDPFHCVETMDKMLKTYNVYSSARIIHYDTTATEKHFLDTMETIFQEILEK